MSLNPIAELLNVVAQALSQIPPQSLAFTVAGLFLFSIAKFLMRVR